MDWQKALEVVDAADAADGDPLACDVWVEEPTLLLQQDTFANFFHDSEDFFNAFIALAVLGWNTRDLRVVLADLYPKGRSGISGAASSSGRAGAGALTAWDLKKRYAGKTVCFKQLALGILGAASPITVASWRTCSATPSCAPTPTTSCAGSASTPRPTTPTASSAVVAVAPMAACGRRRR